MCAIVFVGVFGLACAVSLTLYRRYGTSMDLAIFYQGLANLAGLYPAGIAIKSPGAHLFGDHFHPVMLLGVPVLWCWNSPAALLVLQSAAIAATAAIFMRQALRSPGHVSPSMLLAIGTSPAIWGAASYDIHEVAVGSPLVAVTCSLLLQRRWRASAIAAAACMLIKEDMGALILPCAAILWLAGQRRWAVFLAGWVVGWTWVVTAWVIPAFNTSHRYTYQSSGIVAGMPMALFHSLLVPGLLTLSTLVVMAATGGRIRHPWLLLPVVGNLAYRAAIDNYRYWIPAYHYWLLPFVFVAFATVGWPRPATVWQRRLLIATTVLGVLAGPTTVGFAATRNTDTRAVDAALAAVPAGARAATDPRFAARLSAKAVVSLATPHDAGPTDTVDWVVLDDATTSYGGAAWVPTYLTRLGDTFEPVAAHGHILVLRRT